MPGFLSFFLFQRVCVLKKRNGGCPFVSLAQEALSSSLRAAAAADSDERFAGLAADARAEAADNRAAADAAADAAAAAAGRPPLEVGSF